MDGPKHRDAEMQTAAEMLERLGRRATTREAAEFLGLSVRRVQQLCRAGWLGRRVGSQWLIGREILDFARIERPPGRPSKTRAMPPPPPSPEEWAQIREQLHSRRIIVEAARARIAGVSQQRHKPGAQTPEDRPHDSPPEPRLPHAAEGVAGPIGAESRQSGQVDEEVWL